MRNISGNMHYIQYGREGMFVLLESVLAEA